MTDRTFGFRFGLLIHVQRNLAEESLSDCMARIFKILARIGNVVRGVLAARIYSVAIATGTCQPMRYLTSNDSLLSPRH